MSPQENGVEEHHLEEKKVIDPRCYEDVAYVAESIKRHVGEDVATAEIGIICGSGLAPIAALIEKAVVLPYEEIPGFPSVHVKGHVGNMIFGYIQGKKVICLQGRFHPYEHKMDLALCALPVRIMHLLGVTTMIVSNAAGGINRDFTYGDIMIIKDHIFMPGIVGFSPLVGVNDKRFGPQFVSIHAAYDKELRDLAKSVAAELNQKVHEGVYVMSGGPQYESPAEIRMFMTCGADAIGMSTCHEVTVARQCEMRVFGFSLITNIANLETDGAVKVTHEEVLQTAKEGGERATTFVREILSSDLPASPPRRRRTMSLSNDDAKDALLPFVNSYIEKFNACRFDEMGEFYDVNAVMIEKDKSCLFGRKDISNSLKDMATECGQTEMKISNSHYEGVGDFVNMTTDFEFHTEKCGVLKGKYIQIWRKDAEAKYVIYHDEYQML